MAPPFVLCQPSVQLPSSHAPARNHRALCPSPRHSHHPRLRPASGHEGPCAHSLGNRTPPTTPCASLLSHSAYWASWADTLPILHRQDPTNTATILEHLHRGTAAVPSLQAITEAQQQLQHHGFNPPSWEELAAGRAAPPPWTRPSTSNPRSRMATARRPVIPPQLPPRAPQPSRPRQPSLVGFPVRTARQPCIHHDPLWPRHNLPTAYLPNPALETPPSRVTSVSSPLSVPSHSRPLGRPPFSLCPGRGTTIPRSPTRKSSRQSLPRSRRPRDYQHTSHGLKHRQHTAARRPQN